MAEKAGTLAKGAQGDGSGLSGIWKMGGNHGVKGDQFIGTTDLSNFEIRANNLPAITIVPRSDTIARTSAPNMLANGGSNQLIENHQTLKPADLIGSTISGGAQNYLGNEDMSVSYATIAGGRGNMALNSFATVSGGEYHQAGGQHATIGGGRSNGAFASKSTISGGSLNFTYGQHASIGGGQGNTASGEHATIGGGHVNETKGEYATIAGGRGNRVLANHATASGGEGNILTGKYSSIGGGYSNRNLNRTQYSSISGGRENEVGEHYAVVGGGRKNKSNGMYAFVGGGDGTILPRKPPPLGEESTTLPVAPVL